MAIDQTLLLHVGHGQIAPLDYLFRVLLSLVSMGTIALITRWYLVARTPADADATGAQDGAVKRR